MATIKHTIEYVTGLDGWGLPPTKEEQDSFCAYVVHRLELAYPCYEVTAKVDSWALDSSVRSGDESLDCEAIRSFVGNEVWHDWCGGASAPEVQS